MRAATVGLLTVHAPGERLEHRMMARTGQDRASVHVAAEAHRMDMVTMQRAGGALAPEELSDLAGAFARKGPPLTGVVDAGRHRHSLVLTVT